MPLELGLAIAWARLSRGAHTWFVSETQPRRALKSISDLNGTDFNIHEGTVQGVMRELGNAFVRRGRSQPAVPQMMWTYRRLRKHVLELQQSAGTKTLFEARIFGDVCVAASKLASETRQSWASQGS